MKHRITYANCTLPLLREMTDVDSMEDGSLPIFTISVLQAWSIFGALQSLVSLGYTNATITTKDITNVSLTQKTQSAVSIISENSTYINSPSCPRQRYSCRTTGQPGSIDTAMRRVYLLENRISVTTLREVN